MKRRDFLKALSAIIPVSLIAPHIELPQPENDVSVELETSANDDVWFQNGGAVPQTNRMYVSSDFGSNVWHIVDIDGR